MAIELSDDETYALNILNNTAQNVQGELERTMMARDAYIKLLEIRYKAKFDPNTGALNKKEEINGRK